MITSVRWAESKLMLLDQRKLPGETTFVECLTWQDVFTAIRTMVVRGAPAIGVAAAFGMVLAAMAGESLDDAAAGLKSARPTAVNLFWAVDRMLAAAKADPAPETMLREAAAVFDEDLAMCKAMGQAGLPLIKQGATILTHCNAGALATAGYGTALGVIRAAHEAGRVKMVYADETRPLFQGARLTAWELLEDGIPVTLIADNMAGMVMAQQKIDCVIVGADRIARNGDTANKIGTYSLSVLAKHHGVPFYVAAPWSTIDPFTATGTSIKIEERDKEEVMKVGSTYVAPKGVTVYNPAFDVTPAANITAIVTDAGLVYPPFEEKLVRIWAENGNRRSHKEE